MLIIFSVWIFQSLSFVYITGKLSYLDFTYEVEEKYDANFTAAVNDESLNKIIKNQIIETI